MQTLVEKRVQITNDRAKRLRELAESRGTMENALIEEGLDLLFRLGRLCERLSVWWTRGGDW